MTRRVFIKRAACTLKRRKNKLKIDLRVNIQSSEPLTCLPLLNNLVAEVLVVRVKRLGYLKCIGSKVFSVQLR